MVIGCGGAGKSTLSQQLGEMLNIEVIHLDSFYWQPGWNETPKEDWQEIVDNLVQKEKWIIDGNYSGTLELRLQRADTVIFLDFPRTICLWRILKRWCIHFGRTRPDMREGCPERLNWDFIKWIWTFRSLRRQRILDRVNKYSGEKEIIVLHSPRKVKRFLQNLKKSSSSYQHQEEGDVSEKK